MPSRRSHSKSRNGCVQCKRARVKCDQSWPSCSRCTRSKKACLYSTTLLNSPPSASRQRNPQSATPGLPSSLFSFAESGHVSRSPLISAFEPYDLELMHLYSTSTCLTLAGPDPKVQEAWQVQVPIEAYSHQYLMHSLLAFTALHRNSLSGAQGRRISHESALRHYDHALATSKGALSNVTTENRTSLFVFSAFVATTALAFPLHSPDHQLDDPVLELMRIIALVRGSKSILHTELDHIRTGPLAALIPNSFLAHDCNVAPDTRTALMLLQRHVDACSDIDSTAKATYKHTIELLELYFRSTVLDPENRMAVFSWLATVPDAYVSLLRDRAPVAQICLAYYGVLLHGVRKLWWCGDWGKRLVGCIERDIGGEWQGLMEWPIKKTG